MVHQRAALRWMVLGVLFLTIYAIVWTSTHQSLWSPLFTCLIEALGSPLPPPLMLLSVNTSMTRPPKGGGFLSGWDLTPDFFSNNLQTRRYPSVTLCLQHTWLSGPVHTKQCDTWCFQRTSGCNGTESAVVYSKGSIPRPRRLSAILNHESHVTYPRVAAAEKAADIVCSYKLHGNDVALPYYTTSRLNVNPLLYRRTVIPTSRAWATTFFSNSYCLENPSGRDLVVQELTRHFPIDNYGTCFKNADVSCLPMCQGISSMYDEKVCIASQYLFHFAFENSIDEDYVTEKVYHGLQSDTVTVYLGAPNIDDFLPVIDSVVKVSDFATTEELAKYLIYLAHNETAYNFYRHWRDRPLNPRFLEIMNRHSDPLCDLCKVVHQLVNR